MNGLHLTLRFLGPTPAAEVDAVRTVVAEAARAATPFEVVITGSGAFPSGMKPRTLWLGITDGRAQLEAVAADVSSKLELLGWPPEERPFRGHLTLGRSDGRVDGRAVAQLLDEHAAAFRTSFRADRLVLFESVTGRGPAVYEPLYEASFSA
jgi:2'-5' RNA ligase